MALLRLWRFSPVCSASRRRSAKTLGANYYLSWAGKGKPRSPGTPRSPLPLAGRGVAAPEHPRLLFGGSRRPTPGAPREGRGGAHAGCRGRAGRRGRARASLCPNAVAGGERRCRGLGRSGGAGSGYHGLRPGPEPEPSEVGERGRPRDQAGVERGLWKPV